jgi:hypothetical protein
MEFGTMKKRTWNMEFEIMKKRTAAELDCTETDKEKTAR